MKEAKVGAGPWQELWEFDSMFQYLTIVLQIPRILLASPPTLRLFIAISPGEEAEAKDGDTDVVIIVVPAPINAVTVDVA